ncbi:MAG: metallopeptidase family protein [Sphingomonas sp.]
MHGGKVAAGAPDLVLRSMMTPAERLSGRTPSADDIEAVAKRTLARLPSPFAESLGDVVLCVEELADMNTIRKLGLTHPTQLSGLYEGVSLNRRSVDQSGTLPERVTLFSRPILAEWRSTPFSLDQLVAHIVIHEIGHHFGFSDADMHALERE